MRIGILREEKIPPDDRVILSPQQCLRFIEKFPLIELFVQSSDIRCFNDDQYKDLGIKIVDNLTDCDILFGIKEVPIDKLILNKTYFFFSHTIKKQEYNRELFQALVKKNISREDKFIICQF